MAYHSKNALKRISFSTAHARGTHTYTHVKVFPADETINRVYAACDKITYVR